ncbi:hypothetical protein BRDCF_p642 [Bacteroidales bacterium CF]|nr:hypothetical protein BRDCF_p642 [Bacteroidales bacterium CF]
MDNRLLLSEIPVRNPIMKQPAMFTRSVPIGIDKKSQSKLSLDT